MHIALLGGSFDPPHRGHLQVARFVISVGKADQVWFVPCRAHPFGKVLSSTPDRVAMLERSLIPNTQVSYLEVESAGPSYSIHTLCSLREQHPTHQFQWLLGSDQLLEFPRWFEFENILKEFGVLVYPRAGYPTTPLQTGMELLQDAPFISTSSTEIREMYHQQQNWQELVVPAVATYITEHQLYSTHEAAIAQP